MIIVVSILLMIPFCYYLDHKAYDNVNNTIQELQKREAEYAQLRKNQTHR